MRDRSCRRRRHGLSKCCGKKEKSSGGMTAAGQHYPSWWPYYRKLHLFPVVVLLHTSARLCYSWDLSSSCCSCYHRRRDPYSVECHGPSCSSAPLCDAFKGVLLRSLCGLQLPWLMENLRRRRRRRGSAQAVNASHCRLVLLRLLFSLSHSLLLLLLFAPVRVPPAAAAAGCVVRSDGRKF